LDYANFFKELGRKAWHIGPISLCNKEFEDKAQRGKKALIDEHECLKWLDSKKPNSVVYICFKTVAIFSDSQLKEIVLKFASSCCQRLCFFCYDFSAIIKSCPSL
jgi:hypothetical protein